MYTDLLIDGMQTHPMRAKWLWSTHFSNLVFSFQMLTGIRFSCWQPQQPVYPKKATRTHTTSQIIHASWSKNAAILCQFCFSSAMKYSLAYVAPFPTHRHLKNVSNYYALDGSVPSLMGAHTWHSDWKISKQKWQKWHYWHSSLGRHVLNIVFFRVFFVLLPILPVDVSSDNDM